jgi:ubiquinone/menaquinone biosynthesis C-methylase UbiE
MLEVFHSARSLLEVGCGTGHFTRWFRKFGLWTIGLDLSEAMLSRAVRLGTYACVQGQALELPFSANSFDLVALITTLEFIPDPTQALAESQRVARDGLILGVINRKSWIGKKYQRKSDPVWRLAHLYTPRELTQLAQRACKAIDKITWRTTLWPLIPFALPLPWGGFIGMRIQFSRAQYLNSGAVI